MKQCCGLLNKCLSHWVSADLWQQNVSLNNEPSMTRPTLNNLNRI